MGAADGDHRDQDPRAAGPAAAIYVLGILLVRRHVPESPRWLFIHGHNDQAEELVADVEREVEEETGQRLEEVSESLKIRQRHSIGFGVIAHTAFKRYPKRTVLGLSLFIGQAFDSVGRKPMITLCYVASGVLLIGTGLLFNAGALSATTLTACWVVVFYFASAGPAPPT
jgi:8-oxo-dGTP pyrophosphatase MutT (NUDIX family)